MNGGATDACTRVTQHSSLHAGDLSKP